MSRTTSVAPRVRIQLSPRDPAETPAARPELPLRILVLGDLTLREDPRGLEERRPIAVTELGVDAALASQHVALEFTPRDAPAVRIAFARLDDLTPAGVARQAPDLTAAQLDEVLCDPRYEAVARVWRSLAFLVERVDARENITVEALHCTKQDLAYDLEDSPDIVRSGLYKSVYRGGFDGVDARPFGLLVGDYTFDASPDDVALLEHIAPVAAMAHAPFVAAASPSMFGLDAWTQPLDQADIARRFEGPPYAAWQRLRALDDARHVALTLPRFLLRAADETAAAPGRDLWANAAFALATRAADSFAKYRWCPNMIGSTDGAIEALPSHQGRMPTECAISERLEFELSQAGFIGMVHRGDASSACFLSAPSVQRARYFGPSPEGRAAECSFRLGGQLPYLFMTARLAQHMKVVAARTIGVWMERVDLERVLNRWLLPLTGASEASLLRRASVTVADVPGQPCWYRYTLVIEPRLGTMGPPFTLALVGKIDKE